MADQSPLDYDCGVTRIRTVVKRETDPQWNLSSTYPHARHAVLCFALSGEAVYHLGEDGKEICQVHPGDTLFFMGGPPRQAFSVPENPWRYISVTFDIAAYNEHTQRQLAALPYLNPGLPPSVTSLFQELNDTWTGKGPGYLLKCRALLESVLYELVRRHTSAADDARFEKIEKIRRYIQENYFLPVTVDELAAMAHCSPSHFRMLFKQAVGMTANQYVTMVRIGKAKDFLLSGEMNVSETAAHTGYKDIFYFSRQFKALTGHPPSYYIR